MDSPDILVRRVNQLYHEFTRDQFDDEHRHRHALEHRFWEGVGRRLSAEMRAGPAWTLVDLASGTGFVPAALARFLRPVDRLLALDLAAASLLSAAKKHAAVEHGPRLTCVSADAQALPLADGSADCVTLNAALHHLPSPAEALGEVHRVLRPGGLFALGFEPNQAHFGSVALGGLSRGLDRASWYLSPRQNHRRLRGWLGLHARSGSGEAGPTAAQIATAINGRLLSDGLIGAPLSEQALLDLVDPHARGADRPAGFQPYDLLMEVFDGYEVVEFSSSDYLGAAGRRVPLVRDVVDWLLQRCWPRHGSLFSWLVRKPLVRRRTVLAGGCGVSACHPGCVAHSQAGLLGACGRVE